MHTNANTNILYKILYVLFLAFLIYVIYALTISIFNEYEYNNVHYGQSYVTNTPLILSVCSDSVCNPGDLLQWSGTCIDCTSRGKRLGI